MTRTIARKQFVGGDNHLVPILARPTPAWHCLKAQILAEDRPLANGSQASTRAQIGGRLGIQPA